MEITILNKVIQKLLTKKAMFERDPGGEEGMTQAAVWKKRCPGTEHRRDKGPEQEHDQLLPGTARKQVCRWKRVTLGAQIRAQGQKRKGKEVGIWHRALKATGGTVAFSLSDKGSHCENVSLGARSDVGHGTTLYVKYMYLPGMEGLCSFPQTLKGVLQNPTRLRTGVMLVSRNWRKSL